MKKMKSVSMVMFCLLPGVIVATGCAGADDMGSDAVNGSSTAPSAEASATDPLAAEHARAAEKYIAQIAPETLLARLDFDDGNLVTFEELNGGVLVRELTHADQETHHLPAHATSALDAFKAMAPARAVPAALAAAHARMYTQEGDGTLPRAPAEGAPGTGENEKDLEHSGQFEQSGGAFAGSVFTGQFCSFSGAAPNYIHTNHTSSQTHTTSNVNTAYFASATDIGTLGAQACSDGKCGGSVTIQAGYGNSGFYDAGQSCSKKSCAWWDFVCKALGEVTICGPRKVKFDLKETKISSQIRFHDCAKFTQ